MKTKKILFRSIKFILYIFIILLHYSCQNPPATENNDDNDTIPNAMPQEHIPWPSLADSPWPMYKHDPQLTGRSSFSGPSEGVTDWVYNSNDYSHSLSGIVIGSEGTLYYSGTETYMGSGYLAARNPDGTLKWRVDIGGNEVSNTPLVRADGSILVGSRTGWFYAVNPNGTIRWQYDAGSGIYVITANMDKTGNIYFTTENGNLISLTTDGQERFKVPVVGGSIAFAPSGEVMYVVGKTSGILAVDTIGAILWEFIIDQGNIFSVPVVDSQGNIYFVWDHGFSENDSLAHAIVCLNQEGNIVWKYGYGEPPTGVPGVGITIDHNGHLYFSEWGKNRIYSLNYDGTVKWTYQADDSLELGNLDCEFISDIENNIYFGSTYGGILSYKSDGNLRWLYERKDVRIGSWQSPAIGSSGYLYLINMESPLTIFALQ